MKRFFFDLIDGGWEPDAVGTELPDEAAAQREAVRYAGEVMRHEPERLGQGALRIRVHGGGPIACFVVKVAIVGADEQ